MPDDESLNDEVKLSEEDLAFMRDNGLSPEEMGLKSTVKKDLVDDDIYYLEPRLWPAFECFTALDTQWVWVSTMSALHRTHLDGNAVITYLRLRYSKKKTRKIFNQVMELSRGALRGFNEQ